jgi:hypothetical protein
MFNLTLRSVLATIADVEKQQVLRALRVRA